LGLLPVLSTFALLRRYGHRRPFLLFVGGVALVSVYLVSVYHYTPWPTSLAGSAWTLLDGPLFALAAGGGRGGPSVFGSEAFLVDALALWLAILALALRSLRPTLAQRITSVGIACVVLGVALSLLWPYAYEALWGRWARLGWLAAGVVEGAWVRHRLLQGEATVDLEDDAVILYVALLTMAWVVAMNVGLALHGMRQ
jgi:hypothetical protein